MKIEALRGYRTFIVAIVAAAIGALQTADTLPWGADITGIIVTVLGALAFLLRLDTSTPPGKNV